MTNTQIIHLTAKASRIQEVSRQQADQTLKALEKKGYKLWEYWSVNDVIQTAKLHAYYSNKNMP